jgi:hypothetical protein
MSHTPIIPPNVKLLRHHTTSYIRIISHEVPGGLNWENWLIRSNKPNLPRLNYGSSILAFHGTSALALLLTFDDVFLTRGFSFKWCGAWIIGAVLLTLTLLTRQRCIKSKRLLRAL